MNSIVRNWKQIVILLVAVLFCTSCSRVPSISNNPWQAVKLPTEENILDIAFTGDLQHGWATGTNAVLLETTDGGKTWQPRQLELGDSRYRFSSASFSGQEGWIAGEPGLLLHTTDGGNNWSRIPLSPKLPGNPSKIVALGSNTAEMITNVGAIYKTTDGGQHWKALVAEAVGVIRSAERSLDGKYVAVSAKGNFYSTWEPGQNAWTPHNRNSSRRLQNMGFTQDGGLWMLARGGQVQFSDPNDPEKWQETQYPEMSTSWGLLDLSYRTPQEIWVAGGSGNLIASFDGGKTWQKDREIEDIPSNLYKIVFFNPEKGFIIGQRGYLLKYEAAAPSA